MTLLKKSDRVLKTRELISAFRKNGATVTNLGDYLKWKELSDGSRLSVKLTIYRVNAFNATTLDITTAYFFSDSLDRVACGLTPDLDELKNFLRDKGYKTDRDWYIEDYGMTAETYAAWNAESEI